MDRSKVAHFFMAYGVEALAGVIVSVSTGFVSMTVLHYRNTTHT